LRVVLTSAGPKIEEVDNGGLVSVDDNISAVFVSKACSALLTFEFIENQQVKT